MRDYGISGTSVSLHLLDVNISENGKCNNNIGFQKRLKHTTATGTTQKKFCAAVIPNNTHASTAFFCHTLAAVLFFGYLFNLFLDPGPEPLVVPVGLLDEFAVAHAEAVVAGFVKDEDVRNFGFCEGVIETD